MTTRINNSLFIDYLNCKYKAYLKINGSVAEKTDYETLQNNLLIEYRESATNFMESKWVNDKILKNSSLPQFIKSNSKIGINIREVFDDFDVIFDGIMESLKLKNDFEPIIFVNKKNLPKKMISTSCGLINSKKVSYILMISYLLIIVFPKFRLSRPFFLINFFRV